MEVKDLENKVDLKRLYEEMRKSIGVEDLDIWASPSLMARVKGLPYIESAPLDNLGVMSAVFHRVYLFGSVSTSCSGISVRVHICWKCAYGENGLPLFLARWRDDIGWTFFNECMITGEDGKEAL